MWITLHDKDNGVPLRLNMDHMLQIVALPDDVGSIITAARNHNRITVIEPPEAIATLLGMPPPAKKKRA